MPETTKVIRPAAILREVEARRVVAALTNLDVSDGGTWNITPGVWQRYDKPWDGASGMAGSAKLIGTIGSTYGAPTRYEITLYRVTVTAHGSELGWTTDSLCDDAFGYAGLTLASCARAELKTPPTSDPFRA